MERSHTSCYTDRLCVDLCSRANEACIERNFLPVYAAGEAFALNFLRRYDISDNQVSRLSARGNRVDDSTSHPSRSAKPRTARFIKLLLKAARYSHVAGSCDASVAVTQRVVLGKSTFERHFL